MARQKLFPSTPKRQRGLTVVKDIADFEKDYHHSAKQERKFLIPNEEQKKLVNSIRNNSISFVTGVAGTGKTLFSIQPLYQMLKKGDINQILVIRLMVENKDENIGAQPGILKDKTEEYWQPIRDNLEKFLSEGEINYLFEKEKIKMLPVSFVRGRTFHYKGVIVEEAQNISEDNLLTIATRIGEGSKMVFNGDDSQIDVKGRRGIKYLKQLLTGLEDVGVIKFVSKVNPRHPLISHILERSDNLKAKEAQLKELSNHFDRKEKHLDITNIKWDVDLDLKGQPNNNNFNKG